VEKQITHWTYWAAVVCFASALVWRALVLVHVAPDPRLANVNYMSFYKGALLLFVTAIATTNYAWLKAQKP
jgi:hypothetical protein